MANLDYKSRSLSQLYVFYERLNTEFNGKNKQLYDNVNSSLDKIRNEYRENFRIVTNLRSMSKNELNKELSLLKNIFQVPLDIDFERVGAAKELIDTLNNYMNLKAVYQRSLSLLNKDSVHLSVAQYFPSYFNTVWNNDSQAVIDEIIQKTTTRNKKEEIIKVADEVLTKELPKMVEKAITNMLNSNEVSKVEDDKAYSELLAGINKVYGKDSFSTQLYNLYNLDELKQALLKSLENNSKKTRQSSLQKVKIDGIVNRAFFQNGGISLEYLENLTANEIISKLKGMKNATVNMGGAVHTGATGMKADNIVVFNIDPNLVQETIETTERVSRERNYRMIKDLGKKINNVNDGFIVYSSAKNYSLNENFHGFSSGNKLTLGQFQNLLSHVQENINTFVGGILQTMSGAIGEEMKSDFQDWIAEDIAYFLFDDFETVGLPQTSGTSLHIFNLDGILVPLSFFLWLLADAIEKGTRNPHDIVKAQINSGTIKWTEEQSVYTKEMWVEQKNDALNNITISVSFLQDFKNIMKEFLL